MTLTNTNLEKLIQMATIEQMYSMLQKLKENLDNFNECNFEEKKWIVLYRLELQQKYLKARENFQINLLIP